MDLQHNNFSNMFMGMYIIIITETFTKVDISDRICMICTFSSVSPMIMVLGHIALFPVRIQIPLLGQMYQLHTELHFNERLWRVMYL